VSGISNGGFFGESDDDPPSPLIRLRQGYGAINRMGAEWEEHEIRGKIFAKTRDAAGAQSQGIHGQ
jgi:hypothetical protein